MDRHVAGLDAVADGDLMLSIAHGVAYQRDMSVSADYGRAYFEKCAAKERGGISVGINAGRIGFIEGHIGDAPVLDVGVGTGEFIRRRRNTWGYDVNPVAAEWLKIEGVWADDFERFRAFTFWDVIEHVPEPERYFGRMGSGAYLFASLPIFADLRAVRASKHYRPGEHLYYWTEPGFVAWMRAHGFALLERSDFETWAGRDSILSFAFRKA